MAETSPPSQESTSLLLGPFVGNITHSSVKIWLNVEAGDADKNVFVTLKHLKRGPKSEAAKKDPVQVQIQPIPNPVVVQSGSWLIQLSGVDLSSHNRQLESDMRRNNRRSARRGSP